MRNLKYPVFFPDATQAVLKTLDSQDIKNTQTPGILVNTYHLYRQVGKEVIKKHSGVKGFMNWGGYVISDSGGFQVMSIAKKGGGKISDQGVTFHPREGKKILFTPEKSIEFQLGLKTDMVVVLDDFTPPNASRQEAEGTVRRTIDWAVRSKKRFEELTKGRKEKPLILGVVQGGDYLDLRRQCAQELVKIGFDGFGYGGWPITKEGNFNYEVAQVIVEEAPNGYLLYGLGVGKPEEVVGCVDLGYHIFDCVLPTRDARHKRLYVYNAASITEIDVHQPDFYSFYVPDKEKHFRETIPVSTACDCLLCKNYTQSYLAHLFRIKEMTAQRLATIHNLRFYAILMEKLREKNGNN
jgi:queuine tRNA-ribosyltransferase